MPRTGRICYIEIPAVDVARSAAFYREVFGWKSRLRGYGETAFEDSNGAVSGAFMTGCPPAEPGFVIYIMVDRVAEAVEAVKAEGCEIVRPIGMDSPENTARFRDPGGNVLGLYQEPV